MEDVPLDEHAEKREPVGPEANGSPRLPMVRRRVRAGRASHTRCNYFARATEHVEQTDRKDALMASKNPINKDSAKLDYEPVYQHGPNGTEMTKYQNRDPVRQGMKPSPAGVGFGVPDPCEE
jgi:hypothetical protein